MNNPKSSPFFLAQVAVVASLFAALYLLTLGRVFTESPDTITYIQEIDKGCFFDAPHLLYNPAAVLWLSFWRLFGLAADSALGIESLNAIAGALTVTLFFVILRKRLGLGFFPALCASALPAFSYGLWLYSTTVEVIALQFFPLMLAFYLLTAPRLSAASCFWLGIIHGVAVLFYQLNGLFLLIALDVLLLQKNRLDISRFRAICLYLAPLGLTVVLAYGAVMLSEHSFHSWRQAIIWLLNYAANSSSGGRHDISLATVAEVGIGASHAIIGGHFLFNLPPVKHLLDLALMSNSLTKNAFLARNLPVNAVYLLTTLTIITCVIVFLGSALAIAKRRGSLWRQSPLWRSGLLWLIFYSLFAIVWVPADVEFWIIPASVFWLLLVTLWCGGNEFPARRQTAPALAFAAIAACLAAVNYGGSVYWLTKPVNDYYQVKISPIVRETSQGDLTILLDPWRLDEYLERFSKSDFIALTSFYEKNGEQSLEKLLAVIHNRLAAGRRVFIMEEVLHGAPATSGAGFAAFTEKASRNLHELYAHTWRPRPTEAGTVYRLEAQDTGTDTDYRR